jgi:ribokinase
MITHSLNTEGVDTKGMIIRKGKESQFAFILAEPGIGRRTIFWRRPTGQPPKSRELKYRHISQAKILHTDGLFPEASLAAVKAAKKAGVPVSVDAGSLREGMLELCPYSDYYIASSTFAEKLVGENRPIEACYKLAEYGPQVVGVTLGDRGYVVLHNRKIIKRPAFRVKAVDTTGCGDIFHAGFIYGMLKKWNIEETLDFASWAAAKVSLKMGGRAGIPSVKDWDIVKMKKEYGGGCSS